MRSILNATATAPVVIVVDHDASTRDALGALMSSVGLASRLFASVPELLKSGIPNAPSCLIVEFRLPGMNGLELQARLRSANLETPVIFMSGHGDIQIAVGAMKAGAVDFLPKPVREQDLLDAVHLALERDARRRDQVAAREELESLFESLTAREREVMWHVTAGLMNKQVAGRMGLSEITVKVHRGNVMRKTKSRSLAELVSKAQTLFGPNRPTLQAVTPASRPMMAPTRAVARQEDWLLSSAA
jgi:FixJ family two-component response regulator